MALDSPAGPLTTLDELVREAQSRGLEPIAQRTGPAVLIVSAPAQDWAMLTDVSAGSGHRPLLPKVVVQVGPRRLNQNPSKLTVGRAALCDVVLPFGALSKVHCYVTKVLGGHHVEDAGSTNGTSLNGAKLKVGTAVPLKSGDQLAFGDVSAKFLAHDAFLVELRKQAGL